MTTPAVARCPAARRFSARLGAAALLVVAFAAGACGDGASPLAPEEPASAATMTQELAGLVNQHRQSVGCGPLQLHSGTGSVSQHHSEDMVSRNFFGHTNPDGKTPFDRLRDAGITYRAAGENIAAGHLTAAVVFRAWLNSDGHRANIENCVYTHHGMGLQENRWTHMFLAPR
jgi:uncharacterized protein YkwD